MARQGGDRVSKSAGDNDTESSASTQSKRPSLKHRASDYSQASDQTRDSTTSRDHHHHHHHRPKHHKHHVGGGGGRLHARIPSSKALHKTHTSTGSKLNQRRQNSPSPERATAGPGSGHRRAQSDAKVSRDSSSSNLKSSHPSAASLRRNRSHVDVQHKRSKSTDKLKRTASNPAVNKVKNTKSSVHFDLGIDGQEDEWVDASGSASPYLSRRASTASGQSSAKPSGSSANNSRPQTPGHQQEPEVPVAQSSPDRQTALHKEYLTSRLLQRTPSQGAPPQMTTDSASVSRGRSPDSLSRHSTLDDEGPPANNDTPAVGSSGGDELTSRFVGASSSGAAHDGSFYNPSAARLSSRKSEGARRPLSAASSGRTQRSERSAFQENNDDSALVPRQGRAGGGPPAGQSRIQQKLNLQRASSVVEPSQTVGGVGMGGMGGMGGMSGMGGVGMGPVGTAPLVTISNSGYDGGTSRDPRVARQLERTGMEYLSVRRYQNPIARSLDRVAQMHGAKKMHRIPPSRNGTIASPLSRREAPPDSKASAVVPSRPGGAHTRNVSLGGPFPDRHDRRPVTPRAQSVRTMRSAGGSSSFDADEGRPDPPGSQRLSGSSLVGGEEGDAPDEGLNALLRNLWDKSAELSASQD